MHEVVDHRDDRHDHCRAHDRPRDDLRPDHDLGTQRWRSRVLSFTMNSRIATICRTVLSLPYRDAAMTLPSAEATIRRPETMNSRAMMTKRDPRRQHVHLDRAPAARP